MNQNHISPLHSIPIVRRAAVAAVMACGLSVPGLVLAQDAAPTAQDLQEQIRRLQAQVEQLKAAEAAKQAEITPAQPAAPEPLDAVRSDTERRAREASRFGPLSLMFQPDSAPFLAGYDGKTFVLQSEDGNFLLSPNFQIQLRNVTNINGEEGESFEDIENGSEVRRAKFGIKGHAFSPSLKYDLKWAYSRSGGAATLENAFIDWTPDRLLGQEDWGLRLGQFKDLTFLEESVSSSKQTAVDRSLVNEEIGGGNTDFIQGVGPMYKGEKLRAIILYTEGANSDNTPWNDTTWDYGIAGRVDVILAGDAGAVLEDFTALGTEENSARVGGGFHFAGAGDTRVLWHSLDFQYETANGLGIFAAYFGRWAETGEVDAFDMGGLVQVSQLLGEGNWEAFARYAVVIFDEDVVLGADAEDFFHEFTVGVNRYWQKHRLKATVDVVYLPNGNPGGHSGIGLRPSDGEFDDQAALRAQLQLAL